MLFDPSLFYRKQLFVSVRLTGLGLFTYKNGHVFNLLHRLNSGIPPGVEIHKTT